MRIAAGVSCMQVGEVVVEVVGVVLCT